uniref:Ribosomal protein L6 n=1 Tax=Vischeria stellata TaxID=1104407 RepID=A0A481XGR1_9STRA|nr:ribosomal protein L6 [Vischeria stellata]QBK36831.1 ribosomal protein L6 [Vischeria stellata]
MGLSAISILKLPQNLNFKVQQKEKFFFVKGFLGAYSFFFNLPVLYLDFSKKLQFYSINEILPNFVNVTNILMSQFFVGLILGYYKIINIVGIGYYVNIKQKTNLVFTLGYSHLVSIQIPNYVVIKSRKRRKISLKSIFLAKLNNFASLIKKFRLPSAYKEKGIFFLYEPVIKKQGKKT